MRDIRQILFGVNSLLYKEKGTSLVFHYQIETNGNKNYIQMTRMTDSFNLNKLHSLVKIKRHNFPYSPMWKEMNDCETMNFYSIVVRSLC